MDIVMIIAILLQLGIGIGILRVARHSKRRRRDGIRRVFWGFTEIITTAMGWWIVIVSIVLLFEYLLKISRAF